MITHIFNNQKKFSKCYFDMLKDAGVNLKNHELVHYGAASEEYFDYSFSSVLFIRNFFSISNILIKQKLKQASMIVVHSMASPYLIWLLGRYPHLAKKTYWIMWGKDLYFYKSIRRKYLPYVIYEYLRKKAIKNIGHIVGIFPGECERVKKWYKTNAKLYTCYSLYARSISWNNGIIREKKANEKLTILLGNSASKTNNHIDALEKLYIYKEQIGTIYCPLSYNGSKGYIKKVLRKGKKIFGDSFIGMTEFINSKDYFNILNEVDIGFFYYNRQEGLGNICSLINMGKTIYLKSETSTYDFFIQEGIEVYDADKEYPKMELLDTKSKEHNRKKLKPLMDEEYSVNFWRSLFSENRKTFI